MMFTKFFYLTVLYFLFFNISDASDHLISAKIISGKEAQSLKSFYKKKHRLGSLFSEMEVINAIQWRTKNNSGDILFMQWGFQCRVINYINNNEKYCGENDGKTNVLMDTPCIILKKIPEIKISPEFSISYDVTLIQRRSYDGEYFEMESVEEIKFNKETGDFCSDSYGNINDVCPYSMRENEYK